MSDCTVPVLRDPERPASPQVRQIALELTAAGEFLLVVPGWRVAPRQLSSQERSRALDLALMQLECLSGRAPEVFEAGADYQDVAWGPLGPRA